MPEKISKKYTAKKRRKHGGNDFGNGSATNSKTSPEAPVLRNRRDFLALLLPKQKPAQFPATDKIYVGKRNRWIQKMRKQSPELMNMGIGNISGIKAFPQPPRRRFLKIAALAAGMTTLWREAVASEICDASTGGSIWFSQGTGSAQAAGNYMQDPSDPIIMRWAVENILYYQGSMEWCWAAVATSLCIYYHGTKNYTQICQLVQDKFGGSCCQTVGLGKFTGCNVGWQTAVATTYAGVINVFVERPSYTDLCANLTTLSPTNNGNNTFPANMYITTFSWWAKERNPDGTIKLDVDGLWKYIKLSHAVIVYAHYGSSNIVVANPAVVGYEILDFADFPINVPYFEGLRENYKAEDEHWHFVPNQNNGLLI